MVGILSCSDANLSQGEIRKEVKVFGSLNGVSSTTEVTTRVTGKSWENGDLIGLYMKKSAGDLSQSALANNVKYRTDGTGAFINNTDKKVFYPLNKESVGFISYYPYNDTIKDFKYELNIPINQNNSDFKDFLYSKNVSNSTSDNTSIKLQFTYQLVKVVVKIHDSYSDQFLKLSDDINAEVMISDVNTRGSFSLVNGSFNNSMEQVGNVIFKITEDGSAEALLLPIASLGENNLTVKIKDDIYTLPLAETVVNKSFAQSTQYIYTLKLKGSELIGFTAEIVDRETVNVDGITLSPDPKGEEGSGDAGENTGSGEDGTGDGGDTGVEPNEPDDPDDPDDPLVVENSKDNPYTISEILDKTNEKDIWVKGYIVGSYNLAGIFHYGVPSTLEGGKYNLALADSNNEKKSENTFPVDINVNNDNTLTSFLEVLNLKDNPSNLKKEVLVRGDIGDWLPGTYVEYKRPAIVNLKEVFLEGKKL